MSSESRHVKSSYNGVTKTAGLIAAFAINIAVLAFLMGSGFPIIYSVVFAIFSLIFSGTFVSKLFGFPGFLGLYLFKTQKGIVSIDKLSKKWVWLWDGIVDWGFVMSFGVLSYFGFKKYVSRRILVLGILSLIAMEVLILPYTSVASSILNVPKYTAQTTATYTPNTPETFYIELALSIIAVIGGFAAYIVAFLFYVLIIVIHGFMAFAVASLPGGASGSSTALPAPAGVPVILLPFLKPSITIPLLLSLALLLVIHEVSHGIIARRYKIKLKSVGVILFGIIPVGAFVEPDEKEVSKLTKIKQDKISIAGVSMNFLFTLVFFIPLLLMLYAVLPQFFASHIVVSSTVPNSPAFNATLAGATILKWNNHTVNNFSELESAAVQDTPGSIVTVTTTNRTVQLVANSTGKIGVMLVQENVDTTKGLLPSAINFIYSFIALSFLLNFLIAIFNLLPVPMLDGFRVYNANLGYRVLLVLEVIMILALALLILPWIQYL